jgi:hypothetical protein
VEATTLDLLALGVQNLVRQRGTHPASAASLHIHLEIESPDPVLSAYERDIDRTLIRETLRASVEQRLENLQHWMNAMDELRGAARREGTESS